LAAVPTDEIVNPIRELTSVVALIHVLARSPGQREIAGPEPRRGARSAARTALTPVRTGVTPGRAGWPAAVPGLRRVQLCDRPGLGRKWRDVHV